MNLKVIVEYLVKSGQNLAILFKENVFMKTVKES